MHPADMQRTMINGASSRFVMVHRFAIGTPACHLAFNALSWALNNPVKGEKWAHSVKIKACKAVANHPRRLFCKSRPLEVITRVEITVGVDGEHLSRATPVSVIANWIQGITDEVRE